MPSSSVAVHSLALAALAFGAASGLAQDIVVQQVRAHVAGAPGAYERINLIDSGVRSRIEVSRFVEILVPST